MRIDEILDDRDVIVIDRPKTTSKSHDDVKPPPRYHIILWNDDYSPAEFVAHLLQKHFRLTMDAAWLAMVDVHRKGKGIVATFPKDVAETKAKAANDEAQAEGHPTHFTVEKES